MIDVTEAESLPLDARLIEAGLARLWQMASEGTVGGVVHASSLTLLAVLVDQAIAAAQDAVLAEVAPAHPCRAIIIALAEVEPRARLGAYCRPPRAGRPPTCWEEIRLEGSPAAANRIMSAVGLLVLPNLPVQVWWPGQPDLDGALFRRVIAIGDRIIVDSAQFADPPVVLARYADRAEDEHGRVGFVDLGWRRLEPWRLLTAQFFDAPTDRLFLNDIEAVVVGYEQAAGGPPSGLAAALLLVGWLASRLGWTLSAGPDRSADELLFDDGGRAVRVSLRPRPARPSPARSLRPGLVSLELRATHDGRRASYSIERAGENATSVAEVDGTRREAQVPLPAADEADLLQRELAGFGRDRIYEDALQVVRSLARRSGTTVG